MEHPFANSLADAYGYLDALASAKTQVVSTRTLNLLPAKKQDSPITIYHLVENWYEEMLQTCTKLTYKYGANNGVALYVFRNDKDEIIGGIIVVLRTEYKGKTVDPFICLLNSKTNTNEKRMRFRALYKMGYSTKEKKSGVGIKLAASEAVGNGWALSYILRDRICVFRSQDNNVVLEFSKRSKNIEDVTTILSVTSPGVLCSFFHGPNTPQLGLKTKDDDCVFREPSEMFVWKRDEHRDILLFAPAAKDILFVNGFPIGTLAGLFVGLSSTRIALIRDRMVEEGHVARNILLDTLLHAITVDEPNRNRYLKTLYSFLSENTFNAITTQRIRADKTIPPLLAEVFVEKYGKDAYPYNDKNVIPVITWTLVKTPIFVTNLLVIELLRSVIGVLNEQIATISKCCGPIFLEYVAHPLLISLMNTALKHTTKGMLSPHIRVATMTCAAIFSITATNRVLTVNKQILDTNDATKLKQIVYDFLCSHVPAIQFGEECGSTMLDLVVLPDRLTCVILLDKCMISEYNTEGVRDAMGRKRKATSLKEVQTLLSKDFIVEEIVLAKKSKVIELE